jgi:transposase-like protein
MVREAHVKKNFVDVADKYGFAAQPLRDWYAQYYSGKGLTTSLQKANFTSTELEEAYKSIADE